MADPRPQKTEHLLPASDQKGWSPEETAAYIRYQLSELSGKNGHHEFEQLCFHLAKKRIYPNIIPSTGPVSAGGDQGSDFETFDVGTHEGSPYFAQASDGKVVFACSIQRNYKKKIKADLALISQSHKSAKEVVFFSNGAIPVGIRHDLEKFARSAHGIDLQILDALAIADLLANSEVFWIATRFLSVPSEILLRRPTAADGWYEEVLKENFDGSRLTPDDFFRIKNAIRFATSHHDRHSDLPALIEKLRLFRAYRLEELRRRAFYEEFVASLRGLEVVDDCIGGLKEYFAVIGELSGTGEIEDAAVLVNYCIGAYLRGLLKISLGEIAQWHKSLLIRIRELLSIDISAGRRSSLLDTKALLLATGWIENYMDERDAASRPAAARDAALAAIATWRKMLKFVRKSPMFPLERFASNLAVFAPEYGEIDDFSKLLEETDKLLAKRTGQQKVAEQAFARARAYLQRGQLLKAIDQLHVAHVSAFTRETALETVHIPLFLAKMYSDAKLFAAAKYYALASSFAALKIDDDALRAHAYRGLAEAAACDYANGASLQFFQSLKVAIFVATNYSSAGSEDVQNFEWARLYFYAFILTFGAGFVSETLGHYLEKEFLPSVGLQNLHKEALPDVKQFFQTVSSYSDFAAKLISEEIAPPFADSRPVRKIVWQQLGLKWFVEWDSGFETTAMAEGFIALLQILLADLRNVELSLLRTEVHVTFQLHDGKLQIEEVPDNYRVIRRVHFPKEQVTSELVLGVAATILKMVSAYPHDQFLKIIEGRIKLGLMAKTNPYAPYNVLFHEFYVEDDYVILHRASQGSFPEVPAFVTTTDPGLRGPSGIHKDYSAAEQRKLVQKRYRNLVAPLKRTLPRLLQSKQFQSLVVELRNAGWKDWHILTAIASIRVNFVVNEIRPMDTENWREEIKLFNDVRLREETESDPQPPLELFTVEALRRALQVSQLSTLKGLGFECYQPTPVFEAVNEFLGRFNYWTQDVPHKDPFNLS